MDFVQRFQAIQLHRDTGDELIKVRTIFWSCKGTNGR